MYKSTSIKNHQKTFSQAALFVPRLQPLGKVKCHYGLPLPIYFPSSLSLLSSSIVESDKNVETMEGLKGLCVQRACPTISTSLIVLLYLWIRSEPNHSMKESPEFLGTTAPGIFWKHCLWSALRTLFFSSSCLRLKTQSWAQYYLDSLWINSLSYLSLDLSFTQCPTISRINPSPFYSLSLTSGISAWQSPFGPPLDEGIQTVLDYVPANVLFALQIYFVLQTSCLLYLFIILISLASWPAYTSLWLLCFFLSFSH